MTAFRASYADLKIVKTRGVCQVVLEIPLEQADAALEILGGVPRPDREVWCGVARLAEKAVPEPAQDQGIAKMRALAEARADEEKHRRPFHTLPLPTQAALLCQDERFQTWMGNFCNAQSTVSEGWTTEALRDFCQIESRAELRPETTAAKRFLTLHERYMIDTGQWTAPS